MSGMAEIQWADWDRAVQGSEVPVVVEFWHDKCPYCKKIEPAVKQLPSILGDKASIVRINVLGRRENRRLAISRGVMGTPTFKVYSCGREVGEVVGMETLEHLKEKVEAIVNGADKCLGGSTPLELSGINHV